MSVALGDACVDALGLEDRVGFDNSVAFVRIDGDRAGHVLEPSMDGVDHQMGNGKPDGGVRGIHLVRVRSKGRTRRENDPQRYSRQFDKSS